MLLGQHLRLLLRLLVVLLLLVMLLLVVVVLRSRLLTALTLAVDQVCWLLSATWPSLLSWADLAATAQLQALLLMQQQQGRQQQQQQQPVVMLLWYSA